MEVQEGEVRDTTWYANVKELMERYGIEQEVTAVLKSEWKKKERKNPEICREGNPRNVSGNEKDKIDQG